MVASFKDSSQFRRRKPHAVLPVYEGQEWINELSRQLRLVLSERDFTINPGEAVKF